MIVGRNVACRAQSFQESQREEARAQKRLAFNGARPIGRGDRSHVVYIQLSKIKTVSGKRPRGHLGALLVSGQVDSVNTVAEEPIQLIQTVQLF